MNPTTNIMTASSVRPPVSSGPQQSERVLLSTASQYAEQYYNSGNYLMAKRLLDSITVSYRQEQWRSVLTTVLLTALDCSYRLRNYEQIIKISLELLGSNVLLTHQQKTIIMQQMLVLCYATPTQPITNTNNTENNTATELPLFNICDNIFEVNRQYGILMATSHFITVPKQSTNAVTDHDNTVAVLNKDATVCVGEEFDLILNLIVGLPVSTSFQRIDVFFYCPTNTTTTSSASVSSSMLPSTSSSQPAQQPYHLTLLPGGSPLPATPYDSSPLSRTNPTTFTIEQDQLMQVLQADDAGQVLVDLAFPPSNLSGSIPSSSSSDLSFLKNSPMNQFAFHFTKQTMNPSANANTTSSAASVPHNNPYLKTFRIRMKATVPTTTLSMNSTSNTIPIIPTSPVNNNNATTPLSSPPLSTNLFVTHLLASLDVPHPNLSSLSNTTNTNTNITTTPLFPPIHPSSPHRSLQLKFDVTPTKHELNFLPVTMIEQKEQEKIEREKRAKKKGVNISTPSPSPSMSVRSPTIRILPPSAKGSIELFFNEIGLINEYYPVEIKINSLGDTMMHGQLMLAATQIQNTGIANNTQQTNTGGSNINPLTNSTSIDPLNPTTTSTTTTTADSTVLPSSDSSGGGNLVRNQSSSYYGDDAEKMNSVKFYRLNHKYSSKIGYISHEEMQSLSSGMFEEISHHQIISIPYIKSFESYTTLIFIRVFIPSTPLITATFSYENASWVSSDALSIVKLQYLNFKQPFKIKTKIFSDALSGLATNTNTTTNTNTNTNQAGGAPPAINTTTTANSPPLQRLILNQPALLHVEFENNSGTILRIEYISLDLSTKFFKGVNSSSSNPHSNPNSTVIRECISPAAREGMKIVEEKIKRKREKEGEKSNSSNSNSNISLPCICLAPNEKYTHVFSFIPILAGKTRYTPINISWNRVNPFFNQSEQQQQQQQLLPLQEQKENNNNTPLTDTKDASPPLSSFSYPTPLTLYQKDLFPFQILRAPLLIQFLHPPAILFGSSAKLEVRITNTTEQMQEVEMIVGERENEGNSNANNATNNASSSPSSSSSSSTVAPKLVYSGRTKCLLRLRPHSIHSEYYRLVPLECGAMNLPKIQLKSTGLNNINSSAPSSSSSSSSSVLLMDPNDVGVIFVHPKATILASNAQ